MLDITLFNKKLNHVSIMLSCIVINPDWNTPQAQPVSSVYSSGETAHLVSPALKIF